MDKLDLIAAILGADDKPTTSTDPNTVFAGCTYYGNPANYGNAAKRDNMIGMYVIVRCKDAGVHAGTLEWREGRECKLRNARRLWYWKPKRGAFLSAVAAFGLHESSKVGEPTNIILTENCEIIECAPAAEQSISGAPSHDPA